MLHPTAAVYTFLSSTHGTFMKKDHVLDHKTNFSKFKRTETIQSILSVHNGIKLEITNKYS